jgi:hypothetical protein
MTDVNGKFSMEKSRTLNEGLEKKGGVNSQPANAKPSFNPPPQKPNNENSNKTPKK